MNLTRTVPVEVVLSFGEHFVDLGQFVFDERLLNVERHAVHFVIPLHDEVEVVDVQRQLIVAFEQLLRTLRNVLAF